MPAIGITPLVATPLRLAAEYAIDADGFGRCWLLLRRDEPLRRH